MTHPIGSWKKEFLQKRELDRPTGGYLYTYKLTSTEFDELEEIISNRLSEYLKIASLGDISRHVPIFPALFVLYASEWWKRRYTGSGWSWSPIIEDLGAKDTDWTQAQRSECIKKGLQDWGLQLTSSRGLRFLGSIAFQGGLPMQLLSTSGGTIGRVLGRVLRLASTGKFDAKDVQGWIESLSTSLPQAYRLPEVYVLLTEVILSVLRLKNEASLTSAHGAIEKLNRYDRSWRNYFPIPIEDDQAQALIEQLIRDAADAKLSQPVKKITVERKLELIDNSTWQIRSDLDVPEYIDVSELSGMFGIDATLLTRMLTLRISRSDQSVDVALRRLAGQDRYKFERIPVEAINDMALTEHKSSLITGDGQVFHSIISRGESLSPDLPWLLEPVLDSPNTYRFVRQGAGALSSIDAVVIVPAHWFINTSPDGDAVQLGTLESQNRTIWKIKGNVRIEESTNSFFRVKCGQASAVDEHLEWRGTRYWESFVQPAVAFCSTPKLYKISDNGIIQPVSGLLGWRVPSGKFALSSKGLLGPVDAVWPADGEIKWKSRLVLLPESANIQVEAGATPILGRIIFANFGILSASLVSENISLRIEKLSKDLLIAHLEYTGLGNPPEWFEMNLLWADNPNDARVRIPFPAKGCRAFDGNGRQMPDSSLIPVSNILGIRMVGFLGNSYSAQIQLSLIGSNTSTTSSVIVRTIKANQGEHRIEIRLIDFALEIQRLLAGADNLDALISFKLQIGVSSTTILIARYACELSKHSSLSAIGLPQDVVSSLSLEEISAISVRALRIDAPGEEPVELLPIRTEGVVTGYWLFPEHFLEHGFWLIFPSQDTKFIFRPYLWVVSTTDSFQNSENTNPNSLLEILNIRSSESRQTFLAEYIEALAGDFTLADWQLVEQYSNGLGHLPLSALDIWKCFSKSNAGMAALAMRLGAWPSGFVDRFATELPMMWELIPLVIWKKSMEILLRQCEIWYGKEAGTILFRSHVERRIQDLTTNNPALRALLEVAKAQASGIVTPDIMISQQEFMDGVFAGLLFSGSDSHLQQLLRNYADSKWPVGFKNELDIARSDVIADYLYSTNSGHHDAVVNMPLLIAASVANNLPLEWCRESKAIREIRNIQTFSPDWFSHAFDLTVARCIAKQDVQI